MKIFHFDPSVGRRIDKFGSVNLVLSDVVHLPSGAHVSCFYLSTGGRVGYHQAVIPQLLLVVQGEGWVRGEKTDRIPVSVGSAAYWEKDEWHESSTDSGMMAIVIEGEALYPAEFMSPAG